MLSAMNERSSGGRIGEIYATTPCRLTKFDRSMTPPCAAR